MTKIRHWPPTDIDAYATTCGKVSSMMLAAAIDTYKESGLIEGGHVEADYKELFMLLQGMIIVLMEFYADKLDDLSDWDEIVRIHREIQDNSDTVLERMNAEKRSQ